MGTTVLTKVVLAFAILVVTALVLFFAYRRRHPLEGQRRGRGRSRRNELP